MKTTERPKYSWRTVPSHAGLKMGTVTVGPELGEGPSWKAVFSVKVGRAWRKALEATYGGTGGPTDLSVVGYPADAAERKRADAFFKDAMEILEDLASRTPEASEFDLPSAVEILVGGMVNDWELEKRFRRLIGRRGLVGITKTGDAIEWEAWGHHTTAELCAEVLRRRKGGKVVEWVHETLGMPGGSPLPLPELPAKVKPYEPPEDVPCRICGAKIDRVSCGVYATVCRKVTCDSLNQEAQYAAMNMVRLGVERPPARLGTMVPRLGGYGSQGPIGGLIRLSIQLEHHEWPSSEVQGQAAVCFNKTLEGLRLLAEASRIGHTEESGAPLFVPTLDEFADLVKAFPKLLEAALKVQREKGE